MKEIDIDSSNLSVVSLKDAGFLDKEIIGGKALNLAQLLHHGLPVPEGFCIKSDAFDRFQDNGDLPQDLINKILELKTFLGGNIAIRSSANLEDGQGISMAGVFDSKYVFSNDDPIAAVKSIYSETLSDRVKEYLQIHNIEPAKIKMALVVQKLVKPDFAGVVYTGLGEKGDTTLIQYVDGFGSQLVDGVKSGHTVISKEGVNDTSTPFISELIKYSKIISTIFNYPNQDIEFAVSNNEIYILQARSLPGNLPTLHFLEKSSEGKKSNCNVIADGPDIEGVILNVEDFSDLPEARLEIDNLISQGVKIVLVSKILNLNYDPLIAKSSGLIVENASIVSHGAQRARELGIGAVSRRSVEMFKSYQKVVFHPSERKVGLYLEDGKIIFPSEEYKDPSTLIKDHIRQTKDFIFSKDPGFEDTLKWIKNSLEKNLDYEQADKLFQIVLANMPIKKSEYLETGYDSCQSHRQFSKIVAEAILIGGIIYEASLLGNNLDIDEAKLIAASSLNLKSVQPDFISKLAREHGQDQSFLFPGVTPSGLDTPSIEEFAYRALKGEPIACVRNLSGVGGLRFDKDWNHATDFKTFLKLKVTEDKRYYPGIGIVFLMLEKDLSEFPLIQNLKSDKPDQYNMIKKLIESIRQKKVDDFEDVSVLCSAYLPSPEVLARVSKLNSTLKLELADAFHTPSYELGILKQFFEKLSSRKVEDVDPKSVFEIVLSAADRIWSFNSTIHLPWADGMAYLANGLIGKITDENGNYAIRYGVGIKDRSIEIVEYCREDGSFVYELKLYKDPLFKNLLRNQILTNQDKIYKAVKEKGFMRAGLELISQQ